MDLQATKFQRKGRVAVITLNRPHRNNAWTGRMDTEYRWCLSQADTDSEVKAIVITGAGDRFCVGGDTLALEQHAKKRSYDRGLTGPQQHPGYGLDPRFDHPIASQFGLSKPIIAAIHGAAAGIGLALVTACDLRFAAPETKFTTAHSKLGLPAEYGLSWMLPRIVGVTRAMELLLSSRIFYASEALEIGFLNRIIDADNLVEDVIAYAEDLVRTCAPTSLRQTRRQVYLDLHRDIGTSVSESMRLLDEMMNTEEYRTGVAQLAAKDPPNRPTG